VIPYITYKSIHNSDNLDSDHIVSLCIESGSTLEFVTIYDSFVNEEMLNAIIE